MYTRHTTFSARLQAVRHDIHQQLAERGDTGSVSHGTMRYADLIPAFLNELRTRDPARYAALVVSPFGPVPGYVQDEGDDSEWWDSNDAFCLLEELFDALDDAAPDGTYFGAHPGDGSDYGFWPVDIEEDE